MSRDSGFGEITTVLPALWASISCTVHLNNIGEELAYYVTRIVKHSFAKQPFWRLFSTLVVTKGSVPFTCARAVTKGRALVKATF